MRQYFVKRVLLFVPVVLLVSVIIFAIMRVVPGDIAEVILAGAEGEGRYTQEDYDRLRHRPTRRSDRRSEPQAWHPRQQRDCSGRWP